MKKIFKLLVATFVFSTLAFPVFAEAQKTNSDPTVATVNGTPITFTELDVTYKQNLLLVTDKKVTKEKVLTDLINRVLGIQKAKKEQLENDPTVKYRMEDVLYHALVSKDLEGKLAKIVVSDDDVKKLYGNYPEYRTAHILFRMKTTPEVNEQKAAVAEAAKVYDELRSKPNRFAELANKYSQASTAPNGGDVGFRPYINYAPEYFEAIKGKPVGYISGPVKTQFGYHIIKVLAVKDLKDIDTSIYKKIIYDQKRDRIIEDYFSQMRKEAKITINEKLVK